MALLNFACIAAWVVLVLAIANIIVAAVILAKLLRLLFS